MKATSCKQRRLATFACPVSVAALLLASVPTVWAQSQRSSVLPPPEPAFKGKIGRTYKESQPDKIPIIKAPEGAPNVLVVLIDDVGYGAWSTFGGQIPTPSLDRVAQMGLR